MRHGLKHGHGVYTSKDGSTYTGEYCNDVCQGYGTLKYCNNTVYCGEFENGAPTGFGTLTNEQGVSEGEWVHGKQSGVGTYTCFHKRTTTDVGQEQHNTHNNNVTVVDDGTISTSPSNSHTGTRRIKYVYQGQYQDGYKQGHGTTTYKHFKHVGEYAKGYAEGPGVTYYANKDVYEGDFQLGMAHNQGKRTYADGTVYTGGWDRGRKHGKCNITYPDSATFVGEYKYNEPHTGTGRCVFSNNDVYEGTMKLGEFVGSGSYTHDGSVYVGTWLHGSMHGQFFITWHSGAILRAVYERGTLVSGKGVLYKNGDKIVGQWAKKKMHGRCKVSNYVAMSASPHSSCCFLSVVDILRLARWFEYFAIVLPILRQ